MSSKKQRNSKKALLRRAAKSERRRKGPFGFFVAFVATVISPLRKLFSLNWLRKAFVITFSLTAIFLGGFLLWVASLTVPDLDAFEQRKISESTKIYDRSGEILLYDIHENIRRTVVPFEEISEHMKNATIAIEDRAFYEHRGIRPSSIVRAAFVNISDRDFTEGGSTITQQVIKNSVLTSDKTISRKVKEWVLALRLERELSKEEILSVYLNEIPYGGNLYGVQEASRAFFNKDASELTIAESAYLASLPKAPTYFSPHGNNKDQLEARKNYALGLMLEFGYITQTEFEEARNEEVVFRSRDDRGIKAPHFVMYVIGQLEETYGRRALEEEGLQVITTLDYELQLQAEEIVKEHALRNATQFRAENAALTAIDPQTGQILVMVGSRDYFDKEIDGNYNVVAAKTGRQPGSAFKPFVYAEAFNKGYTPETILFDVQTQFSTRCEPWDMRSSEVDCYAPRNYDGRFRGPLSMRSALAQSLNIPAVKALYLAGINDSISLAQKMGINTFTGGRDTYGLSLVLGGGEITPLDMAGAYGVFATEGIKHQQNSILKITDREGEVLEDFKESNGTRIISEQTARIVSDILSDNVARTPMFGANSPMYFPGRDVAAKTGTTNDTRDAWIAGYTPNISVVVWVGNNDNRSMDPRTTGVGAAGPLWRAFMLEAFKKLSSENFTPPAVSQTSKEILRGNWLIRGSGYSTIPFSSPENEEEYELFEEFPISPSLSVHSILHWVNKNDPQGPIPTNPSFDPQYTRWEYAVQAWAENHLQNYLQQVRPISDPANEEENNLVE